MTKVILTCDRCKRDVEGLLTPYFTGGFYAVSKPDSALGFKGSAFHRFGRDNEDYICDACMWADDDYAAIYAHDAASKLLREGYMKEVTDGDT